MWRYFTFALLVCALVQGSPSARDKRQSCECTPGEAPKCGCQVVKSTDAKTVQMVCSCTPPVAPKCVCRETKTTPALPTPEELANVASQYKCSDVCQATCLEPCQRLQSNSKCLEVCADACQFSCSKQESTSSSSFTNRGSSSISEYKFIIPSDAKPRTAPSMPFPALPVPPPFNFPPPQLSSPASPPMAVATHPAPTTHVVTPVSFTMQKSCEPSCMPHCAFACTTLKPALHMISQVLDGKTADSGECQKTCGDTCLRVCSGSGVAMSECAMNCDPACGETCGFVVKKTAQPTAQCLPQCMPSCSTQCIQTEILLSFTREPPQQLLGTGPIMPVPPPPGLFFPAGPPPPPFMAPPPPPPPTTTTTTTTTAAPQIQSRCQNECTVQCEHQCGVHSLAGPQCLAACQTTCYPVCQAKLRRKHMKPRSTSNNH